MRFARILLAVPLMAASIAFAGDPWVVHGRVVGISDGDTITVLDADKKQHKIRINAIDAPEKGQAFGERPKENLSKLVFDRQVTAECHKRDRYGREVCKVMLGLTDVNLEQTKSGMAWWYREFAKEQSTEDRATYAGAEDDARVRKVGLWKDAKPVPPWEWRMRPTH